MVNLTEREVKILEYWETDGLRDRIRERNKGAKKYYFLDGPPNAYGLAVHHLWVYTIKDTMLKYMRYRGRHVHDRPGFDVHGLPIENKIERAMGLKSKEEIERIGIGTFVKACMDYVDKEINGSIEMLKRLGVFMDFKSTYMPHKSAYMSKSWGVFKTIYDKKLVYKGLKPMAYCPHCETVLSTQGPEVEYSDETDSSVFVRFKLDPKTSKISFSGDTYLVVWTTTPWTLPANMAIAANPKAIYVVASIDGSDYIIAKDRLDVFTEAAGKSTIVKSEFYGSELIGTRYSSPLAKYVPIQKKFAKYHRVLGSEALVSLGEGTGLLHVATGHGPEDYALGKANKIPPFSPIDVHAKYTEDAGKYVGLDVPGQANDAVLADLKDSGDLLFSGTVRHTYPHCWRCGSKLIYRATEQLFINIGKIKKKMLKENEKIKWYPSFASKGFAEAIESSPDWCITRQRYWGGPIPLWICAGCGSEEVIGSVDDLTKRAGLSENPDSVHLHKPYIDMIEFKCTKCSGTMKRIPDIFDVWYESGIAHTASLTDEEFGVLYPADWITESLDQIRGWFSTLLRTGVAVHGKTPYRSVTIGGMMKDELGEEMHRSKGNAITPDELLGIVSVDGFRLWCASKPRWQDLKIKKNELKEADSEIIMLYNIAELAKEFAELSGYDIKEVGKPDLANLELEDRYILSRMNTLIGKFTDSMDNYAMDQAVNELRNFVVEDFSRFYLKFAKQRAADCTRAQLKRIAKVVGYVLYNTVILYSVPAPFSSEHVFRELFSKDNGSVFLEDWPKRHSKMTDTELEKKMAVAKDAITAILNSREKVGITLRWPVSKAIVEVADDYAYSSLDELSGIVESYTNAKKLELKRVSGMKMEVRPLFAKIGPDFKDKATAVANALKAVDGEELRAAMEKSGTYSLHTEKGLVDVRPEHFTVVETVEEGDAIAFRYGRASVDKELSKELKEEAMIRDLERKIQMERKAMGLKKPDRIRIAYEALEEFGELVKANSKKLAKGLNASAFKQGIKEGAAAKDFDIEGNRIRISVERET